MGSVSRVRIIFWRWPSYAFELARDGHPIRVKGPLPQYLRPQPRQPDPMRREKVKGKLDVFWKQRYMRSHTIKSLTSYFDVPKGTEGIC